MCKISMSKALAACRRKVNNDVCERGEGGIPPLLILNTPSPSLPSPPILPDVLAFFSTSLSCRWRAWMLSMAILRVTGLPSAISEYWPESWELDARNRQRSLKENSEIGSNEQGVGEGSLEARSVELNIRRSN